jgi:hypothetical protein
MGTVPDNFDQDALDGDVAGVNYPLEAAFVFELGLEFIPTTSLLSGLPIDAVRTG